jgi:DNA replication protein DnaC
MLIHQTTEKLRNMKLNAMAAEYIRQYETPAIASLGFDERLGMMTDAEWLSRENSRVKKRLNEANLRFSSAGLADVDFRPSRKLDRAYIARLSDFTWVREARNMILTGCTGTGKTWLACAFGTQACLIGLRVAFFRVNRLLNEMTVAAGAGGMNKFLAKLKKTDLLILDDWGLAMLNPLEGRFLLELFEDRYNLRSTIFAAQLPVAKWHGLFEDSTVADAILDRIIHNSHRIELHGPSLRHSVQHANDGAQDLTPCSLRDLTVSQVDEKLPKT